MSKTDLLNQLSLEQLRGLAAETGVSIEGLNQTEAVQKLNDSDQVSEEEVQAKVDAATDTAAGTDASPATADVQQPSTTDAEGQAVAAPGDHDLDTGVTGLPDNAGNTGGPAKPQSAFTDQPEDVKAALDPALTDPVGTARERVQGTTSDAATRTTDTNLADVPPDAFSGIKPSDAGPEQYPFPPQGDVDIATVPNDKHPGELAPALNVDDWVVLDGSHELVPDRLDGHRAAILDGPHEPVAWDELADRWITVRTRDEVNATLRIPFSAVKEVQQGGSAVTHRG